ncbi:hypothetical protein GGD55_003648 [Rhizobium giardinii]|uniref:Uncharacterized protein n=1 Tax=Rhizobium giardinii TaxID=56731 RepID=A0A7W8UCW9_9HYPH|nr:hypothetical protein [Rhizobium giardinii]
MTEYAVHEKLGALLAEVKNLREDFRRSDDKSDASRASVHRRMDDLVDRVGKVEGSVVQVSEDVNEMKPVTDDVRKWKLMGMRRPCGRRSRRHGPWGQHRRLL